jgi:hypothetical protein
MERTNRMYCECDPVVNTKYFCTFDDVDADLARGMGGVAQKGPMAPNCAVFNKVDCSKNWDDRCRFLSNDTRPVRSSSTSLMGYVNGASSQGDDLLVEAARTRFCKVTGGVEHTFNVLDYTDCTLKVTDQYMGNKFECNVEPSSLENDTLFNDMIGRKLGNDIVINMYKNAINSGKNVKGTLLEKRMKEIASTQQFNASFQLSGLGNRSVFSPFN